MTETSKRRLIDQIGDSPTFVAEGSRVTGDLETAGPLVVCGAVRGDGRVGGALRMAATAQWEGEIHTRAAVIAGKITGKLTVGMLVEEALPGLRGIRALGRPPVLLFPATSGRQPH